MTERVPDCEYVETIIKTSIVKGRWCLLPRHPVGAARYQFDGVVDRPEQSLDGATAAPALLVAKYHCLRSKVSGRISLPNG